MERSDQLRPQRSTPDLKQKKIIFGTANGVPDFRAVGSGKATLVTKRLSTRPVSSRPLLTQSDIDRTSAIMQRDSVYPIELPGSIPEGGTQDGSSSSKGLGLSFLGKDQPEYRSPDSMEDSLKPGGRSSPGVPGPSERSSDTEYFTPNTSACPSAVARLSGAPTPLPLNPGPEPKSPSRCQPLFSHPPDMQMVVGLQPGQTDGRERTETLSNVPAVQALPELDSKNASYESSLLGEPGPEISTTESLGEIVQPHTLIAEPKSAHVDPPPRGEAEPQSAVELAQVEPPRQPASPVELDVGQQTSPNGPITLDPQTKSALNSGQNSFFLSRLEGSKREAHPLELHADGSTSGTAGSDSPFVSYSQGVQLPSPETATGPATPATNFGKPAEGAEKDGSHSSGDFGDSLPLKTPLPASRPTSDPKSLKLRPDLISQISDTAPGSPIHERTFSRASSNSARASFRESRDLAPPEEAPAPPAPGGRSMVSPNYAAAGAFEGERKPKSRSGSSISSLKKIFAGGGGALSGGAAGRVVDGPEEQTGPQAGPGADLATARGKDAVWFTGMGKDGVWVTGN